MEQKSGVEYIINSKRPYPEWLRTHTVFKEMRKIDKVFPKIGIPNFKEPCDIMNSSEALSEATRLGNKLRNEMSNAQRQLYTKLDVELKSKEKDRNEKCAKLQSLINLITNVITSMGYNDYAKVADGRVVLKLRDDIFGEKGPIFRKDEAILRVANKLWDMFAECKIAMMKTEQYEEFKSFSRVNIPNKKYTICFSSTGEDGAWDIGTISMRGVSSCQSWNAPQSRGLIGSISSKFVGVIYIASEQDVPGYGSKMLNRSMVRFCIHKTTRKPAIVVDRMYPNLNADTLAAFKKTLAAKSGLEVFSVDEGGSSVNTNYYIPDEPSRQFLRQGEFSYMDYNIPVQTHPVVIKKVPANLTSITDDFKKNVCEDVKKGVKLKREMYNNAQKLLETRLAEYEAAKKKWEEEHASKPEEERPKFEHEKPKLDPELHTFGKGGVMNLLTHCDKKHGADSAGNVFTRIILDSVMVNSDGCTTKEEFHRKYVMAFLRNPNAVKEEAKKKLATGSWNKSFPKSANRMFDTVFKQMKGYVVASCKEMIKKQSN